MRLVPVYTNPELEEEFGYQVYRVNNDVYGNPRYVVHWLAFGQDDYASAKKAANKIGFSVYRAKWFGVALLLNHTTLQTP